MTRLVLINGAPGSGKSTIAHELARDRPMTLAVDIDAVKHSLSGWEDDPWASGLQARSLTLAMADEHLRAGFDVVIGQYLARTAFIEELEGLADQRGAVFAECVLDLDVADLTLRLAARAGNPDRPEHAVNNRLVRPEDARALLDSLEPLRELRPCARWVDASGSVSSTLARVRAAVEQPPS